jgi:hypothetical protein
MKAYWRSGIITPRITDLGTRWRWVVSYNFRGAKLGPPTVCKHRFWGSYLDLRERKKQEDGTFCLTRNFINYSIFVIEWRKQGKWNRWGMQHTQKRQEMHTQFQPVNLKGRDHLEDLGVDGTYRNRVWSWGLNSADLRQVRIAVLCEHTDKHLGSITARNLLTN